MLRQFDVTSTDRVTNALWRASSLQRSIESFGARLEYHRCHAGVSFHDRDGWFRFEQLQDREFGDRVIERIADEGEATFEVAGTYTFRYAIHLPLQLAGYLYAAERRVPVLRDNVALLNREWLQEGAILSPRAIVIEGDELSGRAECATAPDIAALTDALFDQTARLIEPLVDAWSPRRLIARANAWGSALDALASGFWFAGTHAIGRDNAWARWEAAIEGRTFPVRRRPRRLQFDCEGEPDEMIVRSGCCLWYTLPAAKKTHSYCTSCYLISDERRIERMITYRRERSE
jgi:hypothetical protein